MAKRVSTRWFLTATTAACLALSIASTDHPLQALAEDYVGRVPTKLDYVGVLAFEFFEVDGGLKANEIAPRVHNSRHWTIEGAECSQFENHLRAVAGLPLGSDRQGGRAPCSTSLGSVPDVARVTAIADCHLHHYGKAFRRAQGRPRPPLRCADIASLKARIAEVEALIRYFEPVAVLRSQQGAPRGRAFVRFRPSQRSLA